MAVNRAIAEVLRGVDAPEAREGALAGYFLQRARAGNTQRCYRSAWRQYSGWCAARGVAPFPGSEEQVCRFLASLALEGKAPSTIRQRFSALRKLFHLECGEGNVTERAQVRLTLDGICRELAAAQQGKAPLRAAALRRIVLEGLPRDGHGQLTTLAVRDRALLLVMYAAGLRCSEAVSLNWEDVTFTTDGVLLHLQRSKTDQYGQGAWLGVGPAVEAGAPWCPVAALRAWAQVQEPGVLAVFTRLGRWPSVRRGRAQRVTERWPNDVVKRAVRSIGLDPDRYGSHSLRAGLISDLAEAGVSDTVGMKQSRHKSFGVYSRYHRPAGALAVNYTALAGL